MVAHLDAVTCLAVDPNGVFLMSGSKWGLSWLLRSKGVWDRRGRDAGTGHEGVFWGPLPQRGRGREPPGRDRARSAHWKLLRASSRFIQITLSAGYVIPVVQMRKRARGGSVIWSSVVGWLQEQVRVCLALSPHRIVSIWSHALRG